MKRCLVCNHAEVCFNKVYFNGQDSCPSYNEFWICQNKKCCMYIKIQPFVIHSVCWDWVRFMYKTNRLSDLNKEVVKKFNRKIAIMRGYASI